MAKSIQYCKVKKKKKRPTRTSRTNIETNKQTNKYVLFIIGDWNAKVRSQEIPGVTGKFGLEIHNEQDKE